ncbi:apolipoprotein N-acyltransferase [Nitrincola tapanii]|uniref:Apolipoprotein N-acyltransferase n=1 Tax=Nitrincola tapanii TaxID=1708751 RepID=A0A5A9W4Y8_9GAMM|nr:apolipoprotein N-acyltransferase [Nitrincola tapanii]KAA0874631.1 apolipoprotein N-acyltransferase [Nitrincola tapanii]
MPSSSRVFLPLSWALRLVLALLAGALVTLALAPFNLWLLALLSPALLFALLDHLSPRQSALLGLAYGTGFFGAGVSWVYVSIHTFGGASPALASLMTLAFILALALLFMCQTYLYQRLCGRSLYRALGFCGLWLLFEWLRSWFLTGFPWLYLGYAWIDTPWAPLAAVTGVWGLSLLSVLLGCSLYAAWQQKRAVWLSVWLLPALLLLLPQSWTQADPEKGSLRVAVIQPDISQHDKWRADFLPGLLDKQIQLSQQHLDVDLILWPETAIPTLYYQAAPYVEPFFDQLDDLDITLISGFPYMTFYAESPDRPVFHNSLAIFSVGVGVYHKQRLVPFGEYVPFEAQLRGLIDFFDLPMSEFSLPPSSELILAVQNFAIAPLICYEIAYPELTRKSAAISDLLLTVSNDAWFGRSIAGDQHFQIARMRAIENGRWLVRGTNDGISALVDAQGQVIKQAERFSATSFSAEAPALQGQTPYQRWGVWPSLVLSLIFLILGGPRFRNPLKQHS